MRILALVTDAFGGHGGIAKFNRDFLTALCSHPDCKEVVAIPRVITKPTELLPTNLTYVTKGLNGKLQYVRAVLSVVHDNDMFDLIVCGHINLLPVASLIQLQVRAPIILLIHGVDAWQPTNKMLTNYLVKKIGAFIAVSELTKKRFLSWTGLDGNTGFLLPNSINVDSYKPAPKNPVLLRKYGLTGKTVLMTLGRLSAEERYKGIDEILELIPILIKEISDVAYLIVGDGTDRKRLEKKTRVLGIGDRVVFAGSIRDDEKAAHYCLADVYVMPSYGEGFGIVLLEAMACGIPVVASKIDGSREAVRGGMLGVLVNPYDPEEIKEGILEALKKPKGIIPRGLIYFSSHNFERRCHKIIDCLRTSYIKAKEIT